MGEGTPYRTAMVVVAHPDDAEYGCSGTIAKWCNEGTDVVYVICTDGSKGTSDPDINGSDLVKVRRDEQRNACNVLGVREVVFLDYEDAMLQASLELRRDLAREIRRHRPEVVICQNPLRTFDGNGYLGHPDHIAAGEATLSAVFPAARDRLTFPDLLTAGFEPHNAREVMVMHHELANRWIDITDTVDVSLEALKQHVSQVGHMGPELLERVKERKGRNGEPHDMKYAEGFKHFFLS
jgi:LmbE family N-acetylglucosaminyl deacetylase